MHRDVPVADSSMTPRLSLLTALASTLDRLRRLPTDAPERVDSKDGGEDLDIDAAMSAEASELLARHRAALGEQVAALREAIGRCEDGSYGRCANPECGREIAERRLLALPTAEFCIECQVAAERAAVVRA